MVIKYLSKIEIIVQKKEQILIKNSNVFAKSIAVFDIGGTWFRSGIYTPSEGLVHISKVRAYNYENTQYNNINDLQLKLVDYLVKRMRILQDRYAIELRAASIAIGAAVNGLTGQILNSGPLWGPQCEQFDLLGQLRSKASEIDWLVVNDVSAALLRHTTLAKYADCKRINLMTVSSGIACRTFDRRLGYIPLDTTNGLQGEVGHMPINFTFFEEVLHESCDCGGIDHLNAFSSGNGIGKLLCRIANSFKDSLFLKALSSDRVEYRELYPLYLKAIKEKDALAVNILNATTYPLAQVVVQMLTIDPEIDKILMTGGVVHSIEQEYIESLLQNLYKMGMYQVTDPHNFFKKRIELGIGDDNSGLIGAAIAYEKTISRRKI